MKKILVFIMAFSLLMVSAVPVLGAEIAVGEMAENVAPWAVGKEAEVSAKIVAEFNRQNDSGFNFGDPDEKLGNWDGIMSQSFAGGDHEGNLWRNNRGWIMLAEGESKAYALVNEMCAAWFNNGHWNTVGYPTGNQYTEEGKIYQQFSKGYIECTPGDSGSAVFHSDVVLGRVSSIETDISSWAVGKETEVSEKIIAEFNRQAEAEFDFGTPWEPVKQWEDVVMSQKFSGGSHEGNLWNWGMSGETKIGAGFLMYSDGASQAYSLINEMSEAWGNGGHFNTIGFPIGNQFEFEGKIYQNFSKGYLECTPGDSSTADFQADSYKSTFPVGVLSETPEDIADWAVGNEEEVAAKILAEFEAKADADFDFGAPWQPVKHWDGFVMFQPFNGGGNTGNLWNWGMVEGVKVGAGFIMYSEGASKAYSLVNEMSEAWGAKGHWNEVGFPIGNQFEYEGKIYQNFSKGYLECSPEDSSTAVLHAGEKFEIPAGETPSDDKDDENPTDDKDDENPKSSDAVSLGFGLSALISLAGIATITSKKRK